MTNALSAPMAAHREDMVEEEQVTVRDLLNKDTPEDFSAILFLFQSFILMALTFLLIWFVPILWSVPLCFLIVSFMAYRELKRRVYSPVTFSLLVAYPILYYLILSESPHLVYFAPIVFGWLAVVGLGLILVKTPLTYLYVRQGDVKLHNLISGIWVASWMLSALSSYLFMPDTWYLIAPFCITMATFALTAYLSFFDRWLFTRREKEFTLGDYAFKQLSYPSREFEDYIDFYARHITEEVHKNPEGYQTLRDAAHEVDAFLAKKKIPVGVYHHGKLVACCAVTLPVKGEQLPVEQETDLCFEDIRKLGPIADIGRLVIAKEYRERPDVFRGILKAVLEIAFDYDMVFFMSEVFPSGSMFHYRLGFSTLFKRSHPYFTVTFNPVGTVIVFFNNLASIIFYQSDKLNGVTQIANHLNKRVGERWIKRQVLKHAFSRPEQLPWLHTIESIRYLIDQATAAKKRKS